MGLADLHTHTIYSYDGTATVPAVLKRAQQVGLDLIAITDHDEIRGAWLAEELAPQYGLQVLPGMEITTAEGNLLALSIRKPVPAGRPLIETLKRVDELGGFCIAPHPLAVGFGMQSLSAYSIRQALLKPETARILIGIETYNATNLDQESSHGAKILAEHWDLAETGSSGAHVLEAIGRGATVFPGQTISNLVAALWLGTTQVQKGPQWNTAQALELWAANYLISTPVRMKPAVAG